jgi:HD-like signal output (HDOD) protein
LTLLNDQLLTPEAALRLTTLADSVPHPRAVLLQLLRAGDDPLELARVVATDPAMAALLLRTVNSAQFHLSREIGSVQHAITYLGANLVRDIAIRHAVSVTTSNPDQLTQQVHHAVWRGSYLASAIAFVVAQRHSLSGAAELSTQTLLFSLGDLALVTHHPQLAALYREPSGLPGRVDRIQRELGFNSAMIGAHLASVWQLPKALGRVLALSLAPLNTPPQNIEPDLLPDLAVGYFSNRLADVLSAQTQFDLRAGVDALSDLPEAALLPAYLAASGFDDAIGVLNDSAVERRLAGVFDGARALAA